MALPPHRLELHPRPPATAAIMLKRFRAFIKRLLTRPEQQPATPFVSPVNGQEPGSPLLWQNVLPIIDKSDNSSNVSLLHSSLEPSLSPNLVRCNDEGALLLSCSPNTSLHHLLPVEVARPPALYSNRPGHSSPQPNWAREPHVRLHPSSLERRRKLERHCRVHSCPSPCYCRPPGGLPRSRARRQRLSRYPPCPRISPTV